MLWIAASLAAGFPAGAHAQGPAPAVSERETSADNELLLAGDIMVITASKTAQHLSDAPAAITVITADQIQQSGATTIAELMRSVPGVDVMEPNKSQANIAIRGFNSAFSNKVLVMVDGRSINEDIYGNVFWNMEPLLLSRIARIEIVRGPGSVLYGADAFGGVINIISKTPQELLAEKNRTSAVAAQGEHSSTFAEAVNTQGKAGGWAVTAGAGYHGTNGFGDRQPGQVRDSFRTPILTLDAQKQTSRGSLTFSAANSDSTADVSVQADLRDANWHTNSLMFTYNEDKGAAPIMARIYRNSIHGSATDFRFQADVVNADLQQSRRVSDRHQLLYGGSYRQGIYQATGIGEGDHIQNLASLFLQDQILIDSQTNLFAGLRWDHNSIYGSQISPRVSLVRHLPKEQTMRLSYGTAFRAPTAAETYVDLDFPLAPGLDLQAIGNPHLKPEKISSIEAGYRKDLAGGYIGLSAFYNQISNIMVTQAVTFAPSPPYPAGTPTGYTTVNAGGAQVVGFELDSGFTPARGLHALANYSFQNISESGAQVPYSPHHKANLVLNSDEHRGFTEYLAVHFVGAAPVSGGTLRAYTTVDATIRRRLGNTQTPWMISLAATNLLDDRHQEYVDILSPITSSKDAEAQRRTLWIRLDGKF